MHAEFDDYFATVAALKKRDLTSKERLEQLARLKTGLVNWGVDIFPSEGFDLWMQYKSFGTLPYPGCYLDQPMFIRRVFTHFTLLEQWHTLNSELPSTDGIPTLEALISK
jgi:hypothetical protein